MVHKGGKLIATLLAAGVLIFVCLFGFWKIDADWKEWREKLDKQRQVREEKQRKIQLATDLVTRAANCPEEDFAEAIEATDPWGKKLVLREKEGVLNTITILCAGPDGICDTTDDITRNRSYQVNWEKAGENVGEASGRFSQGTLKGLWKSFWKKKTDEDNP